MWHTFLPKRPFLLLGTVLSVCRDVPPWSHTFGAVHLLRLLYIFPNLLRDIFSEDKIPRKFWTSVQHLVDFISVNRYELFDLEYQHPSLTYLTECVHEIPCLGLEPDGTE